MSVCFYSYGNIVRILTTDSDDFSDALMIDVNIDDRCILSVFDGVKKFDADFIRSFINILRYSSSSSRFRLLTESPEDVSLRTRAINILGLNTTVNPRIPTLLSDLGLISKP